MQTFEEEADCSHEVDMKINSRSREKDTTTQAPRSETA